MPRDIPMPHPGTILMQEILEPMGLTATALAKAIHMPRGHVNEICRGNQRI